MKLYEIYEGENSYYILTDYLEGDTLYNYIKTYPDDQLPSNKIREAIKVINIIIIRLSLQLWII